MAEEELDAPPRSKEAAGQGLFVLTIKSSPMSGNLPMNKKLMMCAALSLLMVGTTLYSVTNTVKNGSIEFTQASLKSHHTVLSNI